MAQFGEDPRFAVRDPARDDTEASKQDVEQARHAIEGIVVESVGKGVACTHRPVLALADAAGTDALLLVYARERIFTAGSKAALSIAAVLALPLVAAALMFGGRPLGGGKSGPSDYRVSAMDAIVLCLIDPRKGDALWFRLQPLGMKSLLDRADVEGLIGNAYAEYQRAVRQ